MGKITLLIAFIMLVAGFNVYAQAPMPPVALGDSVAASNDFLEAVNYDNAGRGDVFTNKMGDGVLNVTTCWIDPFRKANEVTQEQGVVEGYTGGFAVGMIEGIARAISGTYDTVTFAFAPYDEPMMKPAYTVKNPNKEGLKLVLFNW